MNGARCGDRPQVEETSYNFYKYRQREKYRDPEKLEWNRKFSAGRQKPLLFSINFPVGVFVLAVPHLSRNYYSHIIIGPVMWSKMMKRRKMWPMTDEDRLRVVVGGRA